MKRLTCRNKGTGHAYFPNCFRGCDGVCGKCSHETEYCETLASYEDTGLTPEQIKEIDRQYNKICKELAEAKKIIEKYKGEEGLVDDTRKAIIEELQKYRQIGTLKECREAKEKQKIKPLEEKSKSGFSSFWKNVLLFLRRSTFGQKHKILRELRTKIGVKQNER